MHHWRHARQLSLCVGDADLINHHQHLLAHQPDSNKPLEPPQAASRQEQLIETLKAFVTTRSQFADQCDLVGVLHASAYILWITDRIRRSKLGR